MNKHFTLELQVRPEAGKYPEVISNDFALLHQSRDTIVVSETRLNSHQIFRAEITTIQGRSVVRLGRWKLTAEGPKRTGQVFEFGVRRLSDVARMLAEVQRHLELDGGAK